MNAIQLALLVFAVLSLILGVVTAALNLHRLREDRRWLESSRDSNQNEDGKRAEDQDPTFPSA